MVYSREKLTFPKIPVSRSIFVKLLYQFQQEKHFLSPGQRNPKRVSPKRPAGLGGKSKGSTIIPVSNQSGCLYPSKHRLRSHKALSLLPFSAGRTRRCLIARSFCVENIFLLRKVRNPKSHFSPILWCRSNPYHIEVCILKFRFKI